MIAKDAYRVGETAAGGSSWGNGKSDPKDDPDHDPINDPETVELNERQHWFLSRVAEGGRCGATDIMAMWNVSLKTARRDIYGLQQAKLLVYVGSRRKGRYRRTQR
jgi:Transcriptional regulators of sugar metabolism